MLKNNDYPVTEALTNRTSCIKQPLERNLTL